MKRDPEYTLKLAAPFLIYGLLYKQSLVSGVPLDHKVIEYHHGVYL